MRQQLTPLAMAVADEVWMLENSVYSVLSPEGFASILWKDSKRAGEAAEVMRLTAGDLLKLEVIEKVIAEPENYTRENLDKVCGQLEVFLSDFLKVYTSFSIDELVEKRYQRFRRI